MIAHTDPQVVKANVNLAGRQELPTVEDQSVISSLPASNDESLEEKSYTNFQGIPVIGVSKVVAGTDWVIFTEVSQDEVFAASRSAILPLILFATLFWGG